jgi:hypothetical protein
MVVAAYDRDSRSLFARFYDGRPRHLEGKLSHCTKMPRM